MTEIALVIVNFNAGAHLRQCVEAAAADLGAREWTGLVVDNASDDRSIETLEGMPRIRVIRNAENRGFGAAINQAVAMTDAPLVWLLNPDCVVRPGVVAQLEATLAAHPECAIAAPQLLNADGTVQASARRTPTAWTGLFGRHSLLTRLFPRSSLAQRELRASALSQSRAGSHEIDWVMGAAMLIRRDAFDAVHGFDERFFLYWEDADLCTRLRQRGWTTRYVPGAAVSHPGGVSAASRPAFATRAFHQSAYLYYRLHVARSPLNPVRWLAKGALAARSRWRIARSTRRR